MKSASSTRSRLFSVAICMWNRTVQPCRLHVVSKAVRQGSPVEQQPLLGNKNACVAAFLYEVQ